MVSYLHAHTINPFPWNNHTEQKRMDQRREGKRKRERWRRREYGSWGLFPLNDQPMSPMFTEFPRYNN